MNTYHLQPCRLIAGHMAPAKEPPLTLNMRDFIGLVSPTRPARVLSSPQVKKGSFVGYVIRKEFFAEGLRARWTAPTPEQITATLAEARQCGRRAGLDREEAQHPFSTFVLNNQEGNKVLWHMKDDLTFEDRLVCVWQVMDIERAAGLGIIEETPIVSV